MNTQLKHSGAYGFGIALVAQHESFEAKDDAGLCVPVCQGTHPACEGGGALQLDHALIVAYKAHLGIPGQQWSVTFVGWNAHKRTAAGVLASMAPHHQSSYAGMDDSFIDGALKYVGATGAAGAAAAFFLRWAWRKLAEEGAAAQRAVWETEFIQMLRAEIERQAAVNRALYEQAASLHQRVIELMTENTRLKAETLAAVRDD